MNWEKLLRNTVLGGACFAATYYLTDPSVFENPVLTIAIPVCILAATFFFTRRK